MLAAWYQLLIVLTLYHQLRKCYGFWDGKGGLFMIACWGESLASRQQRQHLNLAVLFVCDLIRSTIEIL
jgi:hypothetical protein